MSADSASKILELALRIFTGTLVVVLVIVTVAQDFFRYVLNSSLTWSEEVAVFLMIWVVFLGSAILVRRWEHVQIPTLVEQLSDGPRIALIFFTRIASIAFITLLIWYGTEAFLGTHHATSFTTGISTRWIKFSIPVGAAAMLLFALIVLADDIRAFRQGDTRRFRKVSFSEAEAADEEARVNPDEPL